MGRDLVFLDTETTSLDPDTGQVWEIAYAVNNGPVKATFVDHSLATADGASLEIGQYRERHRFYDMLAAADFEANLMTALEGATLVGANPAFDAAFLQRRWGHAMWHYRLLDVSAYTAGALGLDYVPGLAECAKIFDVSNPDHTAAGDVRVTREVCRAAREWRNK